MANIARDTEVGLLERIRERMRREGLKPLTRESREWLRKKISYGRKSDFDRVLRESPTVSSAFIGSLYMFSYSPKYASTLPYYDRYPLVFPFNIYPDGFIGLNMHYLDYVSRMRLMDMLLRLANNKRMDRSTRLRLSWEALKGVANVPAMRACVHRYLSSHISSQLVYINPADYELACFLPIHQFAKASSTTVWRDSLRGGPR